MAAEVSDTVSEKVSGYFYDFWSTDSFTFGHIKWARGSMPVLLEKGTPIAEPLLAPDASQLGARSVGTIFTEQKLPPWDREAEVCMIVCLPSLG